MGRRASVVGPLVGLGLWVALGACGQDYEIRIQRPMKVGQKYRDSVTGSFKRTFVVTASGQVVQQAAEDFAIEFESEVTVLEVDKNGAASKESHAIAKCEVVRGGGRDVLLAPGLILVATADEKGETKLEAQGGPVAPEVAQVLDVVIAVEKDQPTDDDVLGTRGRKRVGDSWPLNSEAAVRGLVLHQTEAQKENVGGTVTLAGVANVGGVECLDVQGSMTMKDIRPPAPPGFRVQTSEGTVTFSLKCPVDVARNRPEDTMKLALTLRAVRKPDPNAPEATLDLRVERSSTHRRTFPK